jgi:hypothetical protein
VGKELARHPRQFRALPLREPKPLRLAALLTEYRDVVRLAVGPDVVVRAVLAALAPLGQVDRGALRRHDGPAAAALVAAATLGFGVSLALG